jgi:acyl-CoA thioester hydrolase
MKKLLSSVEKIRFADCDPMGHLYNGHYLRYMQNAREDHVIEAYGIDPIREVTVTGKGWVVVQNHIAYLRPADANEYVVCESQLRNYTDVLLEIECRMYDRDKTHLKTILWTRFVYMDVKTGKATKHSEDYMKLFEHVVLPVEHDHFEERVIQMRSENKKARKN